MSVFAGRVFLGAMLGLLVVSVSACIALWQLFGPWPPALPFLFTVACVALACLLVSVPILARFVETRIDRGNITIVGVLAPRRIVPLTNIDEAVVLRHLTLPSRLGGARAPRVILRRAGKAPISFTPHDASFMADLESHGIALVTVDEQLTPLSAARRYPRSVGIAELCLQAAVWVAIIAPIIALCWVIWDYSKG